MQPKGKGVADAWTPVPGSEIDAPAGATLGTEEGGRCGKERPAEEGSDKTVLCLACAWEGGVSPLSHRCPVRNAHSSALTTKTRVGLELRDEAGYDRAVKASIPLGNCWPAEWTDN